MSRERSAEEHSSAATPAVSASLPYAPPPLGPRPPSLATPPSNSALSEDLIRRQPPPTMRPVLPCLLNDAAIRSVSASLSESGKATEIGVEETAKLVMNKLMDEFLKDVGYEAIQLAKRRKTNVVQARDLGIVMSKRYGLNVPGSHCGSVVPAQQSGSAGNEHMKRMAAIRRLNLQANRQGYR